MEELAQINPTTLPTYFPPARFANISSVTNLLIPLIFVSSALIFLVIMLIGGFKILTAGGDAENIASAKKLFSYSVFGMVIILLAYLLVKLLSFVAQIKFLL